MLIELLIFIFLGILVGAITGLIPGIHINLVGVFLVTASASYLVFINPIYLIVFISALAITHTFVDFIPSIFLGCPDTDTSLSTLPGHKMLKDGQGYQAVMLSIYGCLSAIFVLIILSLILLNINFSFYNSIQKIMWAILTGILCVMILSEKNKFQSLIVIILTGILGICVLNLENLKEPLFPLLTGLFGSSMLIISIKNKTKISKQKIEKPKVKFTKPILGSLIASPLCGLLPGLGSGQAAIIGNMIVKTDEKSFLVLLGATNTLVMGISFLGIYLISKSRTGAAAAISQLAETVSLKLVLLILVVVLISGIISFFITKFLAQKLANKISEINYTKMSIGVLIFIFVVTFLISGPLGIVILAISTLTGIYCMQLNVKKTNMMGCLLIPTIIYYLA